MRLRLPQPLRLLLCTCIASTSLVSTVSSGTIAIGSAVLYVTFTSSAEAAGTVLDTPVANPFDTGLTYVQSVRNAATSGGYSTEEIATDGTHNILQGTNTIIQVTSDGNLGTPFTLGGIHIALETTDADGNARNGGQVTVNGNMETASVWFKAGRFQAAAAARLNNSGDLYVKGGQLWLSAAMSLSNRITLGASTYEEGNAYAASSIRVDAACTFTGAVTVVENTTISFNGAQKLTLANLSLADGATMTLVQGNGDALCTVSLTGTLKIAGNGATPFGIVGDTASVTVGSAWTLDLSDYTGTLADGQAISGLTLGTATSASHQSFGVTGYDDGDAYITLENGSVIFHTGTFAPPTEGIAWTNSWGLSEDEMPQQGVPLTIESSAVSGNGFSAMNETSLYQTVNGSPALVVVITGTGEGVTTPLICGGYANDNEGNGTTTRDIWLDVRGGEFGTVVGGNYCNNWGGSNAAKNLVGDTHVQLEGGAIANHVIGSQYKDGKGVTHIGNSYVSITGNALVKGNIIGGGTTTHSSSNTITGNTLVTIDNVQYSNEGTELDSMAKGYVVGGSAWTNNINSNASVGGNSAVVVDVSGATLSGTAEQNIFVKTIIGGNYANTRTGGTLNFTTGGNASVTIIGREGVTFSGNIFGGTFVQASLQNATVNGNATVTISGASTFTGNINGAGNRGTVKGDARVEIEDTGTYGTADHKIEIRGTSGATVGGSRILALNGTFTDANFANATLKNFDTIELSAGSLATLGSVFSAENGFSSIKKTGEGTLSITDGQALTGLGVLGGTVSVAAGQNLSLDYLGVAQGATLQMDGSIALNAGGTLAVSGGGAYTLAQNLSFNGTGELTVDLTGFLLRPSEGDAPVNVFTAGEMTGFENATLLLTGLDAQLYKLTYNQDNKTLQLAQRTDIKIWQSGTWNTNADNRAWDLEGTEASFADADVVHFTNDAVNKTVTIEGNVTPGGVIVNGSGFTFTGTGSIVGDTSLTVLDGASLTIENANAYTGGTVIQAGGTLTLTHAGAIGTQGTENAGSLGTTTGAGTLNINFGAADTAVYLSGDSFRDFTGTLRIEQGTVSLGQVLTLGGGVSASLGAQKVIVGEHGTFITHLGNGAESLTTGNTMGSTVYVQSGGTIGNRDGHANWTGDIYLNTTDDSGVNPAYNAAGTVNLSMHWGKYFVWDGVVRGSGTVNFTTGVADGTPTDSTAHRLVLTNGNNTFDGTWLLAGAHYQILGLAHEQAAARAGVNLTGEKAHLVLMGTSAEVNSLDSAEGKGVVCAEGAGNFLLSVSKGTFNGVISDTAAGVSAGTTLGLVKKGNETLTLSGINTYTGQTTVQEGTLAFTNEAAATMHSIAMGTGARLTSASTALTLAHGATLQFDMTGAVANTVTPFISWSAAALTLADATHSVTLSGLDNLEGGTYTLAVWKSLATEGNTFVLTNPSGDDFTYELAYNADKTALVLTVTDNRVSAGFVWAGGSAGLWQNSSAEGWEKTGGVAGDSPNGQDVFFKSTHAGTVTVSGTVTPSSITIMGGDYVFASSETDAGSIADSTNPTTLTVSGAATSVTLNLANTYTGGTTLSGGTLTIGAVGALGSQGDIVFNGGSLVYADDAALGGYDLGSRIVVNDGHVLDVAVLGADNSVTWSLDTETAANVDKVLDQHILKKGQGNLTLTFLKNGSGHYAAAGASYTVREGTLTLASPTRNNVNLGTAADVVFQIDKDARLQLESNNSTFWQILGKVAGEGTLTIGSTTLAPNSYAILQADNSAFTGTIEVLGDGSNWGNSGDRPRYVRFQNGSSLGSGKVVLNGRAWNINAGGDHTVRASIEIGRLGTQFYGTDGQTITFEKALTGTGTWTTLDTDRAYTMTLLGDVSGFSGTLSTQTSNTAGGGVWQFGNGGAYAGAGTEIFGEGAQLAGNVGATGTQQATYRFNYSNGNLVLNALVAGKSGLVHEGTGTLVLNRQNTATGDLSITREGATVQLGTEDQQSQWAGSTLSGAGTLRIVNGSLTQALTRAEGSTATIDVAAGQGATISLGGTSGSLLGSVTLGAGSVLQNVGGNIIAGAGEGQTELHLVLDVNNVGRNAQATVAKIGQTQEGTLTINAPAAVDLQIDAIVDLLLAQKEEKNYLTLTSGHLVCNDLSNIRFNKLLSDLGMRVTGVDGAAGSLIVSGQVTGLYKVTGETGSDPVVIDNYGTLAMYAGVVLAGGQTLTANLAGPPAAGTEGMLVNNLIGAQGSSFVVNNTATGGDNVVVILNNELRETGDNPATVGADTEIAGDIIGNGGVTFVKEGAGTLTVGKTFVTDTLRIREGGIDLQGAGGKIAHLVLVGGEAAGRVGSEAASISIGANTTVGDLTDEDAGGLLTIAGGATLDLTGTGSLNASTIGGDGTLHLNDTLTLADTARMNGNVIVDLAESAALDLGTTQNNTIGGLAGTGALRGTGSQLAVTADQGSVFEGTFEGRGTLSIAAGASQTLRDASVATGGSWNIVNNGTLGIVTGGTQGASQNNTTLALHNVTLSNGSTTSITVNTDDTEHTPLTVSGTLLIQQGASITLSSTGKEVLTANSDGSYTLVLTDGGTIDLDGLTSLSVELDPLSAAFKKLTNATLEVRNGQLVLLGEASSANKYAVVAASHNARAGAELLWNLSGVAADSVLGVLDAYVNSSLNNGVEASRVMAAAAGSTVTSLGIAQKDALRDQMGMIRNRLTGMGVDQTLVNEDMPYFHMWAQATGNHAALDEKGDESGYTLDTWGGTVGLDIDVNEYVTIGAAFTAAYGDLDATAAETANGDFDSYYSNAFVRVQVHRWTHKFIATVGTTDAKLTRTVNYGVGSYKARGTTNGLGWGAMYELTYDTYLNRERTAVLQPLLNVSILRTQMDGYTEDEGTATNAGLKVGRQEMTVGTVALGVRLAGQLSENALGQASFGEFRVNVAQDMGDDRSKASVGFLGSPGAAQTVRGAREGRTAVQIGGGLTVPIAEQSSIFFDVNADFRSHATSVNGSVGYKYTF